jgi:small ligand-binding sensory domain FIST
MNGDADADADDDGYAFASASSRAPTLADAIAECARSIRKTLGHTREVTWAHVFVSRGAGYNEEEAASAGRRTREALSVKGCSRAPARLPTVIGAVTRTCVGGDGETSDGVSIVAASMPGTKVHAFRAESGVMPTLESGETWTRLVKSQGGGSSSSSSTDVVGVMMLAETSFEEVDELLERLHLAMPNSVALGGVVDEGSSLFLNDDVARRGAVAMMVEGDFDFETHVAHGARPVGPVMSLTQAHGSAVLELDDAPAHPLLLETLESLPETAKTLPVMLGLGVRGAKGPFACRDILAVGDGGAVEVASMSLREGVPVQLHVRDTKWASEQARSVIEKCVSSANEIKDVAKENSIGAVMFACGGANRMHANNFREQLPSVPLGGAYVRSEIAPLVARGASSVLSHTNAIGIFRKRRV